MMRASSRAARMACCSRSRRADSPCAKWSSSGMRKSPRCATQDGHAAASFPAKRGRDSDRHRNTKSCRFSGDSPDRLCLPGQHRMRSESSVRYSVVVPFYNEQENIPPLYMKITEVMDSIGESYELIFIDDGSRDNSFKVLSDIYEHDRRVNLVRLRRNFGQTPALKAGFDFARGDVIISMDGDLQHDPEEIPRFLEKIEEGFDLVSGWRHNRRDHWLMRQLPSRAANWMMAKLSGIDLHDFGTTFKAYRREIIQEIQLYGELHRFIPALASSTGARIAEVPIENLERKSGRSNYGIGRTIRVFLDLIIVKFLLDYSTRPLQFFGLLGVAGAGLGMLLAIYLAIEKFV